MLELVKTTGEIRKFKNQKEAWGNIQKIVNEFPLGDFPKDKIKQLFDAIFELGFTVAIIHSTEKRIKEREK